MFSGCGHPMKIVHDMKPLFSLIESQLYFIKLQLDIRKLHLSILNQVVRMNNLFNDCVGDKININWKKRLDKYLARILPFSWATLHLNAKFLLANLMFLHRAGRTLPILTHKRTFQEQIKFQQQVKNTKKNSTDYTTNRSLNIGNHVLVNKSSKTN